MGHFILKINDPTTNTDYYLEWSVIVDAPVTYGLELDEFTEYYRQEYGEEGMRRFPERMERVKQNGSSSRLPPEDNVEYFFKHNRAGEKEATLDKEGILDRYCRIRIG